MKTKTRIVLFIAFAIFAFFYFKVNPSQVGFLPKCPLYTYSGIYCPGCGSQRAVHELLHLNFIGFIKQNALLMFLLLFMVYNTIVILANTFFGKTWINLLNHKKAPYYILAAVILFWILRNLHFEPFSWLAPY